MISQDWFYRLPREIDLRKVHFQKPVTENHFRKYLRIMLNRKKLTSIEIKSAGEKIVEEIREEMRNE